MARRVVVRWGCIRFRSYSPKLEHHLRPRQHSASHAHPNTSLVSPRARYHRVQILLWVRMREREVVGCGYLDVVRNWVGVVREGEVGATSAFGEVDARYEL